MALLSAWLSYGICCCKAFTVLLFLTLKRLLDFSPQGPLVAWVAALVFAVHPIHTEAVASVVGRAELVQDFSLTAWLLHLENHEIAVVICFALALSSKESALAFVPLVIVGDYVRGKWKALYAYVATAVTAVAYLALLWKVQGGHFGAASVVFLDNPLGSSSGQVANSECCSDRMEVHRNSNLSRKASSHYSYNAILLYANLRHLAPAAIAAVLLMAVWLWTLKTNRKNGSAGTIYVAGFAITANISVPTGTIMGERLAYLPSAGYCLLVALIWIWLLKRQGKLAWTVLAIFLAALDSSHYCAQPGLARQFHAVFCRRKGGSGKREDPFQPWRHVLHARRQRRGEQGAANRSAHLSGFARSHGL